VISSQAEHYNRIPRKERKKTFVDEIMADSDARKFAKRKFLEVQYENSRGYKPQTKKRRKNGHPK